MDTEGNEIDWDRLDRYVTGRGTDEELAALERWVNADPALKQLADSMRTVGRQGNESDSKWDERAAWAATKQRMHDAPVRPLHVARSSGERRAATAPPTRIWRIGSSSWTRAAAVLVL